MHRSISKTAIAIAAFMTLAAESHAAVLYDSTTGTTRADKAVQPHIPPTSGDLTGEGDDYGTAFTSLTVTGLSFLGSVGPSTNFTANFYDSSANLVTSVTAASGELSNTIGMQTFGAADFGPSGITVPGSGYVVFSVTSSDGVTRPSFGLEYQPDAASVGSNNTSTSAQLDYQGNFSTGAYVTGSYFNGSGFTNVPSNVAQFQITGTGVPEPTSMALLATPLAMALRRRRA